MSQQQQANPDEPGQANEGEAEGFGSAFSERASDGDKDSTAGTSPATNEPAPAGSEAAPSQEAAGAPQAEPAATHDPLDGLTPEQRQYVERLQASDRSQRGRVGALTKKLNHQERAQAAQAPTHREEQPREQADGEPAKASDLEARLAQVAEEYGDINGPIIEAIREIRSKVDQMQPAVEQVDLDKTTAEIEQSYVTLEGRHPDFALVAQDPNFLGWAEDQPRRVQELLNSYDPDEVSLGLTLFKAERGASLQASGQGGGGSDTSTATGDRRARQLDGSKQVSSRGTPAAAGVPNEFGSAFKARAEQART